MDLSVGIASCDSIIKTFETNRGNSATLLRAKDVYRFDKQDDGAAYRTFESSTMQYCISDGHTALGAYLFVLGQLFDAALSRHIRHTDRLRVAFTAYLFFPDWKAYVASQLAVGFKMASLARKFLASQTFDLLLRQCRPIVLMVMAHAKEFPKTLLCPWLHNSEVVEHLFGIAKSICPDFSLLEFQHVVPRIHRMQRAWISGDTGGLNMQSYGGNSGYVHSYYIDVDIGVLRRLARYPTGDDVEEAMFKGRSDANYVVKLLRFDNVPMTRHIGVSVTSNTVPREQDTPRVGSMLSASEIEDENDS